MTEWIKPIPSIGDQLLNLYDEAHQHLYDATRSVDPTVADLWTSFARRTTLAMLANVRRPLMPSPPCLFPPPRTFLSAQDMARISGIDAACRYVESRWEIVQGGHRPGPLLLPETPYVLHALAEGRVDNPVETNPGMARVTDMLDALPVAARPPAPSSECRQMLAEAVEVVADSSIPCVMRAGWMLFTIGEIHPFVDGNGRVARLVHLLLAGEGLPERFDAGVNEQIRWNPGTWVRALAQPDPEASVTLLTEFSIEGAQISTARLRALAVVIDNIAIRLGLPEELATIVAATWLRRRCRVDLLAADLGRPYELVLGGARALETRGILERRLGADRPLAARPTYSTSPDVGAAILAFLDADIGA